jgi:hypothetical protein
MYGHLALGEIDRLTDRTPDAVTHYRNAEALCRRIAGHAEVAYALLGLAEIAREHQHLLDVDSATLARQVITAGETTGLPWLVFWGNLVAAAATGEHHFLVNCENVSFRRRAGDRDTEGQTLQTARRCLDTHTPLPHLRFNLP